MSTDARPTHLDLFSGIGGFALAAEWAGFRTVAFVERNHYCQAVLSRHWPEVPVYGDACNFGGRPFCGVDLLTGGFPCQPFSNAGLKRGKEDDRYLWPEMLRIIQSTKPRWVVGENVAGLDGLGLDDCISDLEASGYEVAPPLEIPACAVGAWHIRNRVWICAHAKRSERRDKPHGGASGRMGRKWQPASWDRCWQVALREFRGMDDGLSYGVDRIDCLRNAIVPQVAYEILKAIRDQMM